MPGRAHPGGDDGPVARQREVTLQHQRQSGAEGSYGHLKGASEAATIYPQSFSTRKEGGQILQGGRATAETRAGSVQRSLHIRGTALTVDTLHRGGGGRELRYRVISTSNRGRPTEVATARHARRAERRLETSKGIRRRDRT